jgi:LmbE family N-acetylglucosaminyl deacetylase
MKNTTDIHQPDRIVGIWAHPDDEAYLSAVLMARVIDAGGHVTVVCLTDGELGFAEDDPRTLPERRAVRRREMRTAMSVLGVHDVIFMAAPDGGLAGNEDALIEPLGDILRTVDPDMILSFGPEGITGHPDHIASSTVTTRVAQAEGYLDRLFYACETEAFHTEFQHLHDELGIWMGEQPDGTSETDVVMRLDLAPHEFDRKRAALAGHASQTDGLAAAMGEDVYKQWWRSETFRRPTWADVNSSVRISQWAA